MPKTPPNGMPRVSPNVFYDDVGAAVDFLTRTFGFEVRMSMPGADGEIVHAELQVHEAVVMMSPTGDSEEWASPRSLGGRVTQSLYVYVDEVDGHCSRARAAGAPIVAEPEDMFWGDRTYVALDPEGHRWTFAEAVREVDPAGLKPPA